jgi:hypothetical protein
LPPQIACLVLHPSAERSATLLLGATGCHLGGGWKIPSILESRDEWACARALLNQSEASTTPARKQHVATKRPLHGSTGLKG